MNSELINIYIEKLLGYIAELTKTNLLLSTQLSYQEKLNTAANEKIIELEAALDKAKSKSKKTDSDF